MFVPYRILLPPKLVEKANGDVEQFKNLVQEYVARGYPHYQVICVKDGFIECKDSREG